MALNEKYSHKDFTQRTLTDTKPEEWNDTEVVNSCFYNEKPRTQVFPDGTKGVKFIRCNLDNVIVPKGCTTEGCSTRLIGVQNDLEDWILDQDLKPVEPLRKARYERLGLSVDPRNLSAEKLTESPIETKVRELGEALEAQKDALDAEADTLWRG